MEESYVIVGKEFVQCQESPSRPIAKGAVAQHLTSGKQRISTLAPSQPSRRPFPRLPTCSPVRLLIETETIHGSLFSHPTQTWRRKSFGNRSLCVSPSP